MGDVQMERVRKHEITLLYRSLETSMCNNELFYGMKVAHQLLVSCLTLLNVSIYSYKAKRPSVQYYSKLLLLTETKCSFFFLSAVLMHEMTYRKD